MSVLTPPIITEYDTNARPKAHKLSPNVAMSLSPANQLTNPPILGKLFANSLTDFAAVTEFEITSLSIPATERE